MNSENNAPENSSLENSPPENSSPEPAKSDAMTPEQLAARKSNRLTLLALLAIFVVPVASAYIAYFSGWFSQTADTVNQGELVKPVLQAEVLALSTAQGEAFVAADTAGKWWWFYATDSRICDSVCELNLVLLRQTHTAVGKESLRIKKMLVSPAAFKEFEGITQVRHDFTGELQPGYIYVMDPLGNIVLRYPQVDDREQAPPLSKDMIYDMKKLLKFSRIG